MGRPVSAVDVEFHVLGPLQAIAGGQKLSLGGRTPRALLAALLLQANESISVDRLVETLWDGEPPATAEHAIKVYVSRLRKVLGPESIRHTATGYVLYTAPGQLDLDRFEQLVETARVERGIGNLDKASVLLREALALWRGDPLADLDDERFAQGPIERLEELRLSAIEMRVEIDLELGRHKEVVPELEAIVARHPFREELWGLLMLALYQSRRQADALAVYQKARSRLLDELGIEPSPALRKLQQRILLQDASLELAPQREEFVRSVLVAPETPSRLEELARVAAPLAGPKNRHELILLWLERPRPAEVTSGALAGASAELARLQSSLEDRGIDARVAAFTSEDRSEDLLRLATRPEVDLLILGINADRLSEGPFDDEIGRILSQAPCDVALWLESSAVRSPQANDGALIVPFGAHENDWAALELGAWLAGAEQRPLVLLGTSDDSSRARRDASRMLADAGLLVQRYAGVLVQPRLIDPGRRGLLDAASEDDLLIVGISERWPREGLGTTRLEVARSTQAPVLLVRRGVRPGGISPPDSLTRYRWSMTVTRR